MSHPHPLRRTPPHWSPLAVLLVGALVLPGAAHASLPLRQGAKGPRVAAVQRALHQRVDRLLGPATIRAVERLQRRHGLAVVGMVGPQTWALVKRLRARQRAHRAGRARGPRPAAAPRRRRADRPHRAPRAHRAHRARRAPRAHRAHRGVPRVQTHGARVALLQRVLGLQADGVFGAATAAAVRRYQSRHGTTADGVVGPATWAALGHPRIHTVLRVPRPHAARGLSLHGLPVRVRLIVAAADAINRMPYRYGGGHGNWHDSGYDCSGSVSYALHGGGLLPIALDSGQFMGWGAPGPGRWITVYANPSHAYMVVAGRRFDTSGRDATGGRWQADRGSAGYVARHPPGL